MDGKVVWNPTSKDRVFATTLGDYQITVGEVDDPEYPDQPDYEIRVHDAAGRWIETISNTSLRPFMDDEHKGMNPYVLLQSLHRIAQRAALGVDKAVRDIIRLLHE
jgi:hypothetical protein